jgi:NADH-quinone oxidoreductase subunit A
VLEDFLGVLLMLGVAGALAALLLALPRRFRAEPAEAEPSPISARQRYATRFLLAASFFALLEFAAVLLIPWAVLFREVGSSDWLVALIFVLPVAVGIHYQWRKGVLEW